MMKMRTMIIIITCAVFMQIGVNVFSQQSGTVNLDEVGRLSYRKEIALPALPGYVILKCDFHIHTVFSDGNVWPTVRVDEAWEDGLDAIAITDHIEGNPKKLPGQNHQAYEIALPQAKTRNIILVKGGEISRSMPPGHFNALFLKDVNALNVPDYRDAFREASKQGAFIEWNHPGWRKQQPDTTRWMAQHDTIYANGWMHGIEVFNEKEWYPEALRWAAEKKLAIIGNSDIHDVFNRKYNRERFPVRAITLVFAKERSEESLKEAMFARRTATLFFNRLIGPEEFIVPLVKKCLTVSKPFFYQDGFMYFEIRNDSDIEFTLIKKGSDDSALPAEVIIPRRSVLTARAKQEQGVSKTFTYIINNVLTAIEVHPELTFTLK